MSKKAKACLAAGALAAAVAWASLAPPVSAEGDSIFVPLFTLRTGPFANSGGPIANGMRDYLMMLNERDGGIGGVKIHIEECEMAYDTDKGVACYDQVRTRRPAVVNPWSTAIVLKLLPRLAADKIPLLSMGYGLSASAKGSTFPWAFNPPATYWDGMTMIMQHISTEVGGMRRLAGQKFGYVYLDAGFGREPIPLIEQLAKDFGFDLKLYPVNPKDMANQDGLWKQAMADKRDFMIMFGWGNMNPVAVKTAASVGFPMNKFFSIWWPSDGDMRSVGEAANGFKTLNWHNVGQNYPAIQDILTHVVAKKLSKVASTDEVGELVYNHGVYNSMLIAEAIRTAQKITGKKVVDGADVRRGFESLDITAQRLKEMGFDGFTEPIRLSCEEHNGHRPTYIQQWHGTQWLKISGQIQPMRARLAPLLEAAVTDYTSKNGPWPERQEPCDKPNVVGRADAAPSKTATQNVKE